MNTDSNTGADACMLNQPASYVLEGALYRLLLLRARGADGASATDQLWRALAIAFGEKHARRERGRYVGSAVLHELLQEVLPLLFHQELSLLPVIWAEVDAV